MGLRVNHLLTRTKKDVPTSLKSFNKAYHYSEVTRPDKFFDPYVGKDYSITLQSAASGKEEFVRNIIRKDVISRPGTSNYITSTEVTSMAMEELYYNPYTLAMRDPDLFDYAFEKVIARADDVV